MAGVYRDQAGREVYRLDSVGATATATNSPSVFDTVGGVVPVWKAHAYTYDASGNLATDTVTDASGTWVRTYMWSNGAQASDSGWVKQ